MLKTNVNVFTLHLVTIYRKSGKPINSDSEALQSGIDSQPKGALVVRDIAR
jgi:hypothetical protein